MSYPPERIEEGTMLQTGVCAREPIGRPEVARVADRWRRRVLVVEDHPGVGESLKRLLAASGYDVRLARDGVRALVTASVFDPDVVLLDLELPGMSGGEVGRRLRRSPASSRATLVAVTGWDADEARRRTAGAGFAHYLVKPVDIEIIESLIDSLPM
jgi:DNA-binding response OmpR family regulator